MRATLDEIIVKPLLEFESLVYNMFLSPFFIFVNLWRFLLPDWTRSKVAESTGNKRCGKSRDSRKGCWQSQEKLCSSETQNFVVFLRLKSKK